MKVYCFYEVLLFMVVFEFASSNNGGLKRLMFGPKDSGGKCPSQTNLWNKQCCCGANCCWDHCEWSKPPANCLKGVPNSQWIFNNNLGYYQAFQNTGTVFTYLYIFLQNEANFNETFNFENTALM